MKETQNSKSEFMSSIHLSIYSTLKLNISSLPCIVILYHTFSIHIIGILHSMHIGTNMITRCKGCSMFCFCVRQIATLVIIVLRQRVLQCHESPHVQFSILCVCLHVSTHSLSYTFFKMAPLENVSFLFQTENLLRSQLTNI